MSALNMPPRRSFIGLVLGWFAGLIATLAVFGSQAHAADEGQRQTWTIDGVEREALVFAPPTAKTAPTPLIIAYHGHGGSMNNGAERFACEKSWPEAICVYPQGLTAPGQRRGNKSGWQHQATDMDGRDLKFFDVMLAGLKKDYQIDPKRIFVTGFSNGADFTFLLWTARADLISAVAPCAGGGEKFLGKYKSMPAMIVCGEKDPHYKIDSEKRTIEALKTLNECDAPGEKWGDLCTFYPSKAGRPVASYIHPLGHKVPPGVMPMMVKFFQSLPPAS